jgi:hypothetical protein
MSDRALWALMQRVERCRYEAECVEHASRNWPEPWRSLAADIAAQWRHIAEQQYARSIDVEPPELSFLSWRAAPTDPASESEALAA